jgi:hypothetical protein
VRQRRGPRGGARCSAANGSPAPLRLRQHPQPCRCHPPLDPLELVDQRRLLRVVEGSRLLPGQLVQPGVDRRRGSELSESHESSLHEQVFEYKRYVSHGPVIAPRAGRHRDRLPLESGLSRLGDLVQIPLGVVPAVYGVCMTRTEHLTRDQVERQRADILARLELSAEELDRRGEAGELVGDEWLAWAEVNDLTFLLGE